jgi:hypothetical protein
MDWPERRSGNEVVLAGGWRDAAWTTRRGPEADRFRALRGLALQPRPDRQHRADHGRQELVNIYHNDRLKKMLLR